ncbi:glycerophosphodiester phosphodiesterase [Clostridium sp. SHJSY1]|uniref:glycerophosphodiester phosphodiesterase n=1 Tax=Clostridium sp. SHJSY1 TaxID=2942483 RepID=UPI0028764349|nr:glycerophosphodiester phosphodiesterase [Clostridium sp. SHJSY1]MDS0527737.1 glycerophosphodiester phosphodiesterase [Clostridium sp. SHJSY1]
MKILNIAHRGYSGKFDENTMLAFEKSIEYNADGIETDVQMSKDGFLVLIHDETLDRTIDGKGYVKDYTLAELKRFKTKNGEEIPTLKELLELVSKSNLKVLNLELKNSILPYEGLEEKVLDMIKEYNLKERIIISSFNHLSLSKIRKFDKEIKLGALTSSTLANVPEYLWQISVECYHPFFPSILNEEYIKEIKNAGIMVNPYTVNMEEHMKMVIKAGVDSIITNEVETLNKILYGYIEM